MMTFDRAGEFVGLLIAVVSFSTAQDPAWVAVGWGMAIYFRDSK